MTEFQLPETLPELRTDITISRGGVDINKTPTWIIHDLNNNSFYHIGWLQYQMLSHWYAKTPKKLIETVNEKTTVTITEQDVSEFLIFLSQNCILKHGFSGIKKIAEVSPQLKRKNIFQWLIKNYLFIRVPLAKPDRFLTKIYPYCSWLFSKLTVWIMVVLGLIAIYFVSRQWEVFSSTLAQNFNPMGFLYLMIAMFVGKIIHEMGHALMCKRFGLTVPSMGVAFLVMWPVLYTDTGQSWKLPSNRDRLMVSIAGVWFELYLAVLATLLWLVLDNSPFRSAIFFIASTSWVISILINISPFLRFDGYFVLSDLLGVRNLQTRSFAYTRWGMRKILFGFKQPPPEPLNKRIQTIFVTYAILTWVYRAILFFGIALLVYHFFFKVLGLILFVVELVVFIFGPLAKEVMVWWKERSQFHFNKNIVITSSVLVFLLFLFFFPWQNNLSFPATLSYVHRSYYSPETAQVEKVYVTPGQYVSKGQQLVKLHSGELIYKLYLAEQDVIEYRKLLENMVYDQERRKERIVVMQQVKQAEQEVANYKNLLNRLRVVATISGKVSYIDPYLRYGAWIKDDQMLLTVVNDKESMIEAFTSSGNLDKLQKGKKAVFIPDVLSKSKVTAKVESIDYQPTQSLFLMQSYRTGGMLENIQDVPTAGYHASTLGGSIGVRADSTNNLVPETSQYRITLIPDLKRPTQFVERGVVMIEEKPSSYAKRSWAFLTSLFVSESGF